MTVRDAGPADEDLLLAWANEPEVRQAAFNSEPIDAATHARWFAGKLADADTALLIAERDGRPVGYTRLERVDPRLAEIGVLIGARDRGRGLGAELIALGTRTGAAKLGVERVLAHVKPGNEASLRAFRAAGYEPAGRDAQRVTLIWDGAHE
jgi:RimJ/RimL family protein N-acetyltransferase